MFKLWSESNRDAKKNLKPDLGLRQWGDLSTEEKKLIWKYLELYFFNVEVIISCAHYEISQKYENGNGECYLVEGYYADNIRERINYSVEQMQQLYKAKNYTNTYTRYNTHYNACTDFHKIFTEEDGHAVIELLSHYCIELLYERSQGLLNEESTTDTEFEARKLEWRLNQFNIFANELNDVFGQFGLNIYLTRNGFIPKQDDKIIKNIFEPVLECLSDEKWAEVSKLFSDAFAEFRKSTPNSYSTCITHTVSAIQAYLQILVYGKTGVGDISKLIPIAQNENLIPSDMFTKKVFDTIESVLMRERQEKGDSHPKKEYANERNAKLVLNLAMVFLQHCIQN